jgi:Armadillo/beta-catenin-like repeat
VQSTVPHPIVVSLPITHIYHALQVSDGVIPALVSLVRALDLETVRYACAALCRLCSKMENGNLILESGAVPNLVERSIKGEANLR